MTLIQSPSAAHVRAWLTEAWVGTPREGTVAEVERPTFLDVLAWLWRWVADAVVALLTRPARGRHVLRRHVGASDASVAELAAIREALTDTVVIPVIPGPVSGWALEATVVFTDAEREDADLTFGATLRLVPVVPDATEVALLAAVRQAGGAA